MPDVEISSQAEDHLDKLEAETRERILKKLAEARDWPGHRLDPLPDGSSTNCGPVITA